MGRDSSGVEVKPWVATGNWINISFYCFYRSAGAVPATSHCSTSVLIHWRYISLYTAEDDDILTTK